MSIPAPGSSLGAFLRPTISRVARLQVHLNSSQVSSGKDCQQDIGVWVAVKDEVENQDIELHIIRYCNVRFARHLSANVRAYHLLGELLPLGL